MRTAPVALAVVALAALLRTSPDPRPAAPRVAPSRPAEAAEVPPVPEEPSPAPPPAALPDDEEPVVVDHVLPRVRWLLAHQNPDGSWGDARTTLEGVEIDHPGITGLALLCLLNAGYSHLSKDVYDERRTGVVLRQGLQWLLADQGVDGLFRSSRSRLDHALAAFALAEAYGLTGSNLFKDRAQGAIDGLVGLQCRDGSWGDRPTTAWATEALLSARAADLWMSNAVPGALLAYYDRWQAPDAGELLARLRFERQPQHPAVAEGVARLLADGGAPSLHQQYFRSRAMYLHDGPSGPAWTAWSRPFWEALRARPPLAGAGLSELTVRASLEELCADFPSPRPHFYSPK